MNENSILTGRRFIESSLISAEYAVICPQRRNLRFSRFQIWLHTQCVMIFRADTNSCPPENAPFGWSAGAIAGWNPPSVPRPLGFRGDFCRWAAASGLVPPRIRRPGRAAPFPPPAGFADGVEGSRRQAARLRRRWARARACRCSSSPIRWTLKAVTDRATLRANPSAPYDRTRSLPRCSRLWIADSTAGCCRRIFRNIGSASRFRSA